KNRIAIATTLAFIRHDRLDQTYQISEILIRHPEDLMQKGVGWMLREAGKRDRYSLIDFLNIYAGQMPRTMLGYAIERFEPDLKRYYRGLVAYSN
ncbi:DNA alkylation repair protein, partial [Candidatus Saccharibacteria bacterium]|nr:DNA alkylation repair protein [Candidatus Saccharibacteria bacterium]